MDDPVRSDAADGAGDESAARSRDKAGNGEGAEETEIEAAGCGAAGGEHQSVRPVQTHAEGLGLDMAGVHVEVELLLDAALVIDVAEESERV